MQAILYVGIGDRWTAYRLGTLRASAGLRLIGWLRVNRIWRFVATQGRFAEAGTLHWIGGGIKQLSRLKPSFWLCAQVSNVNHGFAKFLKGFLDFSFWQPSRKGSFNIIHSNI